MLCSGPARWDTLRQRRSFKWRTYPADVLPAFVAEMDFDLARPVIDAVTGALALGDCGYGHIGVLGACSPGSPRTGWAGRPTRPGCSPSRT